MTWGMPIWGMTQPYPGTQDYGPGVTPPGQPPNPGDSYAPAPPPPVRKLKRSFSGPPDVATPTPNPGEGYTDEELAAMKTSRDASEQTMGLLLSPGQTGGVMPTPAPLGGSDFPDPYNRSDNPWANNGGDTGKKLPDIGITPGQDHPSQEFNVDGQPYWIKDYVNVPVKDGVGDVIGYTQHMVWKRNLNFYNVNKPAVAKPEQNILDLWAQHSGSVANYPGKLTTSTEPDAQGRAITVYRNAQGTKIGEGGFVGGWMKNGQVTQTDPNAIRVGEYKVGNKTFMAQFKGDSQVPFSVDTSHDINAPASDEWKSTGNIDEVTLVPGQTYSFLPEGRKVWAGANSVAKIMEERNITGNTRWTFSPTSKQSDTLAGVKVAPGTTKETLFNLQHQAAYQQGMEATTQAEIQTRRDQAAAAEAGRTVAAANQQAASNPRQWIDYSLRVGTSPRVPGGILARIIGQQPGQLLQKSQASLPTPQEWNTMTGAEKEQLMGYLEYSGINPQDWMMKLSQSWTPGVVGQGIRWGITRQR